jgi:hypothetical protein
MRHWVYALVLGILLGLGLGVGVTLLWHSERKQATPPVVVALFDGSGNAEYRQALGKIGVKMVNSNLLGESFLLRQAERKDEPEMTRYRKVSQEFGAKLLVSIRVFGGPNEKQITDAQIFEVDSGVLCIAWCLE